MKVEYINPFTKSTVAIFKNLLEVKIVNEKPVLTRVENSFKDISAVIGLAGDITGSVVISFPKLMALKIVSKMTGREIKILDEDVIDAIGELINIITGNAKSGLEQFNIMISLPNIVRGQNHDIVWPQGIPIVTVPFKSDIGDFTLMVSFKAI